MKILPLGFVGPVEKLFSEFGLKALQTEHEIVINAFREDAWFLEHHSHVSAQLVNVYPDMINILSLARTKIRVCRVDMGSVHVYGKRTPEKTIAVNMMAAVSPSARVDPRRIPVTIPKKHCGMIIDLILFQDESPTAIPASR